MKPMQVDMILIINHDGCESLDSEIELAWHFHEYGISNANKNYKFNHASILQFQGSEPPVGILQMT